MQTPLPWLGQDARRLDAWTAARAPLLCPPSARPDPGFFTGGLGSAGSELSPPTSPDQPHACARPWPKIQSVV